MEDYSKLFSRGAMCSVTPRDFLNEQISATTLFGDPNCCCLHLPSVEEGDLVHLHHLLSDLLEDINSECRLHGKGQPTPADKFETKGPLDCFSGLPLPLIDESLKELTDFIASVSSNGDKLNRECCDAGNRISADCQGLDLEKNNTLNQGSCLFNEDRGVCETSIFQEGNNMNQKNNSDLTDYQKLLKRRYDKKMQAFDKAGQNKEQLNISEGTYSREISGETQTEWNKKIENRGSSKAEQIRERLEIVTPASDDESGFKNINAEDFVVIDECSEGVVEEQEKSCLTEKGKNIKGIQISDAGASKKTSTKAGGKDRGKNRPESVMSLRSHKANEVISGNKSTGVELNRKTQVETSGSCEKMGVGVKGGSSRQLCVETNQNTNVRVKGKAAVGASGKVGVKAAGKVSLGTRGKVGVGTSEKTGSEAKGKAGVGASGKAGVGAGGKAGVRVSVSVESNGKSGSGTSTKSGKIEKEGSESTHGKIGNSEKSSTEEKENIKSVVEDEEMNTKGSCTIDVEANKKGIESGDENINIIEVRKNDPDIQIGGKDMCVGDTEGPNVKSRHGAITLDNTIEMELDSNVVELHLRPEDRDYLDADMSLAESLHNMTVEDNLLDLEAVSPAKSNSSTSCARQDVITSSHSCRQQMEEVVESNGVELQRTSTPAKPQQKIQLNDKRLDREDLKGSISLPSNAQTQDTDFSEQGLSNIDMKIREPLDMDGADGAEDAVKAYEVPFVSENAEENKDNEDPAWNYFRLLETDEERYKMVRSKWKSLVIPDPNKNLTYHSFRRTKVKAAEPVIKLNVRKRKRCQGGDNGMEGPSSKKSREINLDFNLQKVSKVIDDVFCDFQQELNRSSSQKRSYLLEQCYQEKVKHLRDARTENIALHQFYSGLEDQGTVFQEHLEEEQFNIEQIYSSFKRYYNWDGKMFLPK